MFFVWVAVAACAAVGIRIITRFICICKELLFVRRLFFAAKVEALSPEKCNKVSETA